MKDPLILVATPADTEVIAVFDALADAQRGEPEAAMRQLQHAMGGGEYSFVVEHVGDLTHRMAKGFHAEMAAGYEWVSEKVLKTFPAVKRLSEIPGEFERNRDSNAEYNAEEYGTSIAHTLDRVERARVRYAQAHRQLVVYNRAQFLAREAAVDLGRLEFSFARVCLFQLKEMIEPLSLFDLRTPTPEDYNAADGDNEEAWRLARRRWGMACRESWTRTALEYSPGPDGLPLPYPWRKREENPFFDDSPDFRAMHSEGIPWVLMKNRRFFAGKLEEGHTDRSFLKRLGVDTYPVQDILLSGRYHPDTRTVAYWDDAMYHPGKDTGEIFWKNIDRILRGLDAGSVKTVNIAAMGTEDEGSIRYLNPHGGRPGPMLGGCR